MRPPYPGFGPGKPNPVVCGRRFCPTCGRWRLLVDFGRPGYARALCDSYCQACRRQLKRAKDRSLSEREIQDRREYQRFWMEARRRREGITPRAFKHRKTVVDRAERVLLDTEPLVDLLKPHKGELNHLADKSGVSERSIARYISGESRHVLVGNADRITHALGIPLSLVYPGPDA